MRKRLPIIVLWGKKTIDVRGDHELRVPMIWMRRGTHLVIKNIPKEGIFLLNVNGSITIGNVSMVPIGMTEADLTPVPPEKINIESKNYKGTLADQK